MKSLFVLLAALLAVAIGTGELEPAGGNGGPVSCCTPYGNCKVISSRYCRRIGGVPLGYVQLLSEAIPEAAEDINAEGGYYGYCEEEVAAQCPGACCFPDRCEWASELECDGLYRGNSTNCMYDCNGACCTEGSCEGALESECMEGTFHGVGTHCLPGGMCPKTDWIAGMSLLFAVLFFLSSLAVLIFICRRNRA